MSSESKLKLVKNLFNSGCYVIKKRLLNKKKAKINTILQF